MRAQARSEDLRRASQVEPISTLHLAHRMFTALGTPPSMVN